MRVHCFLVLSILLFLNLSGYVIASVQEQDDKKIGIFDRLIQLAKGGAGKEEIFPMPKCMFVLSGGIDQIETKLQDELEKGKSWSILITAKSDQTSVPAVKAYYDAVRQLCGEEDVRNNENEGASDEQSQNDAFDDHSSPQDAYVFDPSILDRMAFAHMSFDSESGMMWRWWIWKVPSIVFVTSATSSLRSYDIRFWKIAFNIPSSEKVIAIIKDRLWTELNVWDSIFAPGGEYQNLSRFFSQGSLGFMSVFEPIPNWLLGVIASMFGSIFLSYLHRNDAKSTQQQTGSRSPANKKTQ